MNKARMFGGIGAMMTSAIAQMPWAPSSMCSIEGEGGEGAGGGGASGLLDDATPTPSPTPTPSGTPTPSPTPTPGPTGGDDALAWASGVSTTADGENASNFDWLKSKGVKDLDGLVKMTRDTEAAFHGKGTIKIPGEGAKPEEVAAFNKAIGVPDKAEDYTVELPAVGEGDSKLELDTGFLDPMRAAALKAGIPKAAFGELGAAYVQHQLDTMANAARAQDGEVADLFKEWGPQKDANVADFKTGAKLLGLNRADIAEWQATAGSRKVMEKLASIGKMAGEDLLSGGARQNFGVASQDEAQKQINTMSGDKDVQAKLKAKDPATVATWNRLNDAVAEFKKRDANK